MHRILCVFTVVLVCLAIDGTAFQTSRAAKGSQPQEPDHFFKLKEILKGARSESVVSISGFTAHSTGLYCVASVTQAGTRARARLVLLHTDFQGNLIKALDAPPASARGMLKIDDSARIFSLQEPMGALGSSGALQVWGAGGTDSEISVERPLEDFCASGAGAVLLYQDGSIESVGGLQPGANPKRSNLGLLPGRDPSVRWKANIHCSEDRFIVVDIGPGTIYEGDRRRGVTKQKWPAHEAFASALAKVKAGQEAVKGDPAMQLVPVSGVNATSPDGATVLLGLNYSRLGLEGYSVLALSLADSRERLLRLAMPRWGEAREGVGANFMIMAPRHLALASGLIFVADSRGMVARYTYE